MLVLRGMGTAADDALMTPSWAADAPKPKPSSTPIWTEFLQAVGIRPASALPTPAAAATDTNWPLIIGGAAVGVGVLALVMRKRR